jgi:hypothetical protein
MATVTLSVSIQASGGPQISASRPIAVEAYDKIEIKLDPGGNAASEVSVQLQPSAADKVSILALSSSLYGKEITYKISDGATDSVEVELDQPQLLTGGSVKFLGTAPKIIKFKNKFPQADATKKAQIEIFVGRQATG